MYIHDHLIGLDPREGGFLNETALPSAVTAPRNTYYYEGGDLCLLAATYLVHIGQAHAFNNGNKRTAYAAALTFLDLNGIVIARPSRALEDATVAVAKKEMTKGEVAVVLRALANCAD